MKKRQSKWNEFIFRLRNDAVFNSHFCQKFWSKIDKTKTCWEWSKYRSHAGYGCLFYSAEAGPFNSHRVAFAIANPEFSDWGKHILHRCDNPPCCNPEHLFAGTPKENIQDCIVKKRFKFCAPKNGERSPNAKLSLKDAKFIKKHFSPCSVSGPFSRGALAKKFNVSQQTIYRVAKNLTWKEADGPININRIMIPEVRRAILERFKPHSKKGPNSRASLAKEFGVTTYAVGNLVYRHKVLRNGIMSSSGATN